MPKICYEQINFKPDTLAIIADADRVLTQYAKMGIIMTLRQLYYRMFALGLFPDAWKMSKKGGKLVPDPINGNANNLRSYKKLGSIIADARMSGYIDWNHLADITRTLREDPSWDSPGDIIRSAAHSYHRNLWEGQKYYVEVWVEKDALLSVLDRPCRDWDTPYFACRGYSSITGIWETAQRLLNKIRKGHRVMIIHLGDHDPSGVDMTRDVEDRIRKFIDHHLIREWCKANPQKPKETDSQYGDRFERSNPGDKFAVDRVALTMAQITEHNAPPAIAKTTDSRAEKYIAEHGEDCWELDALPPEALNQLIIDSIHQYLDVDLFEEKQSTQEHERKVLTATSENWDDIADHVENEYMTEE